MNWLKNLFKSKTADPDWVQEKYAFKKLHYRLYYHGDHYTVYRVNYGNGWLNCIGRLFLTGKMVWF